MLKDSPDENTSHDQTIIQPERIMRTRRKYMKTHLTRPRKNGAAKTRRRLEQRRRLVALGMDEKVVARMNSREILDKLKRPAKVAKEFSS